jgi:hypothetical protein
MQKDDATHRRHTRALASCTSWFVSLSKRRKREALPAEGTTLDNPTQSARRSAKTIDRDHVVDSLPIIDRSEGARLAVLGRALAPSNAPKKPPDKS